MPTQETLTRHHLIGAQGVVISAVPSPASGRSGCRWPVSSSSSPPAATSRSPPGRPVYVVEALSDTAVEVVSTAPDLPNIHPTHHPAPEPGGNHP